MAVVYGPNNDDPNFFLQLSEKIGAVENEAVIAAGDWNVVLDYEWDTAGYKRKNNPKANAAVLDLMKILDLGTFIEHFTLISIGLHGGKAEKKVRCPDYIFNFSLRFCLRNLAIRSSQIQFSKKIWNF